MNEIAVYIFIIEMSFFPPAILAVWFFGIRPFVAKHGHARITAANWGLSMWADWSTAYEIGKETGSKSLSAKIFLILWFIWVCVFIGVVIL